MKEKESCKKNREEEVLERREKSFAESNKGLPEEESNKGLPG